MMTCTSNSFPIIGFSSHAPLGCHEEKQSIEAILVAIVCSNLATSVVGHWIFLLETHADTYTHTHTETHCILCIRRLLAYNRHYGFWQWFMCASAWRRSQIAKSNCYVDPLYLASRTGTLQALKRINVYFYFSHALVPRLRGQLILLAIEWVPCRVSKG